MTATPHYASSLEHPSVMQAPVSTTQTVTPAWQGKFALFPARPGSKVQYSGRVSIPSDVVPQLVAYLQSTPPSERGVELWLTGFMNTAKNTGQQYIGGYVSPQQQGPAVAYAQQQMASPAVQQQMASPAVQQQMVSPAVQQQYANPAPPAQPTQWQTSQQTVPQYAPPAQQEPPF